jgi:hypothetical protein
VTFSTTKGIAGGREATALRRFAASGTATWVALGALYVTPGLDPRRRALTALKAAARYDQAVRPPFRIVEA